MTAIEELRIRSRLALGGRTGDRLGLHQVAPLDKVPCLGAAHMDKPGKDPGPVREGGAPAHCQHFPQADFISPAQPSTLRRPCKITFLHWQHAVISPPAVRAGTGLTEWASLLK